jgi:hypothetical protein
MTKTILHRQHFDIDFYWKGLILGVGYDDSIITICLPFFLIHIKLFMFGRKRKSKPSTF